MDFINLGIFAATALSSGVVGYALAKHHFNEQMNNVFEALYLQIDRRSTAEMKALELGAERDALQAQAERTRAKLSEAGRAGAIKSNAARAERRKVASAATVRALAHSDLRPRDAVVAGVAEARQAKKISGGAVASKTGG